MCSMLGSALTWGHPLSPHHQPDTEIILLPVLLPHGWCLNLLVRMFVVSLVGSELGEGPSLVSPIHC